MPPIKEWIKSQLRQTRRILKRFFPVTKEDLEAALRKAGLKAGDTVFVHSSFNSMGLFDGTPLDVINILLRIIGKNGNLMMPAFPMAGFMKDYLDSNPVFDPAKTPSQTGIMPELFRRIDGVKRSVHPTHSVIAFGPRSEWLTKDHYKHLSPFGEGTPFAKLCEVGGKVLLLGVGLNSMTLMHTAEDAVKEKLPLPIYMGKPYKAKIIVNGREEEADTYVHKPLSPKVRDIYILYPYLRKAKILKKTSIGFPLPFSAYLVDAGMFVDEIVRLAGEGKFIYKDR